MPAGIQSRRGQCDAQRQATRTVNGGLERQLASSRLQARHLQDGVLAQRHDELRLAQALWRKPIVALPDPLHPTYRPYGHPALGELLHQLRLKRNRLFRHGYFRSLFGGRACQARLFAGAGQGVLPSTSLPTSLKCSLHQAGLTVRERGRKPWCVAASPSRTRPGRRARRVEMFRRREKISPLRKASGRCLCSKP